jgi:hypothetical protein
MTPEDRSLLERTYKLAEENNHILRSIRRHNRWMALTKFLYWVIIIGISIGAFYFIQPYFEMALNLANQANSSLKVINGTTKSLESLNIDSLKGIVPNI